MAHKPRGSHIEEFADHSDPEAAVENTECTDVPPEWAIQLQAVVADRLAGFESTLHSLIERLEPRAPVDPEGFDHADPDEDTFLQSEMLPLEILTPSVGDDTLSVMLGSALCDAPELQPSMLWLREQVMAGSNSALALVGQLLVFRCAAADRKPSLLKDVGEAYYRCFPKTRDVAHPFENAVAAWTKQLCEEAGLPNSIELVHPGERFDSVRHSPVARGGVEVAEVLGWVVLRDGGRVYSKALVQTR